MSKPSNSVKPYKDVISMSISYVTLLAIEVGLETNKYLLYKLNIYGWSYCMFLATEGEFGMPISVRH